MIPWNDDLVMQFYGTVQFYDDSLVLMNDGHRYDATIAEWAAIIGAPEQEESDVDVYADAKQNHNSMANMYKTIPH